MAEIWYRVPELARSERAQQNGPHKRKHGAYRQHIEPQSKVHVTVLLVAPAKNLANGRVEAKRQMFCDAEGSRKAFSQACASGPKPMMLHAKTERRAGICTAP
jgi:hypothetical protein